MRVTVVGRGPDHEPLLTYIEPLARLDQKVVVDVDYTQPIQQPQTYNAAVPAKVVPFVDRLTEQNPRSTLSFRQFLWSA